MTGVPQGTLIWQRFRNVSCLRTHYGKKKQDSFDPHCVNLLCEDSVCTGKLVIIPRVTVFFFLLDD